ncbi:MAG: pyruvate carboxylase, partial [Planctomycetes bacterium]|nr:pyruvate carboxylase [Planctomycetota bacterium]
MARRRWSTDTPRSSRSDRRRAPGSSSRPRSIPAPARLHLPAASARYPRCDESPKGGRTIPNIDKLLCANRGEIAIRVFRAATELGMRTVAIYSHEDRVHLHRYKADESYLVGTERAPVEAYLGVDEIIAVAKENGVDAIHPGYGFLSERADFAARCEEAGIVFVGPPASILHQLGDKVSARRIAMSCGVPVVPGTPDPVRELDEVRQFVVEHGFPVLLKAAMGGGGRGMRVIRADGDVPSAFEQATREAAAAFGDGTLFMERYLERPRHIEVQILGDSSGRVVHLFERDCSVQRRHQKLIEMAPAVGLDPVVRNAIFADALAIAKSVGYVNAGTVEFLVDGQGRHYFIEVNPRIQVEHTVTEQVTGIDLVQAQIRIARGETIEAIGIDQDTVSPRGFAIQCRVTTEDPEAQFAPDTGRIEVYRTGSGMGIRLDGGSGYPGARISPYYDPLLVKVTGSGRDFEGTRSKLDRALTEFRIRGVKTNIPFLLNVLRHPRFHAGDVDTTFIDDTPELFLFPRRRNRAQRLLRYLGELAVNGPLVVGAAAALPSKVEPTVPPTPPGPPPSGWRTVLDREGPAGFARAVREHRGLLLMDTTWRDAHQSLLATRVRTRDLLAIAGPTAHALAPAYSLEMWGGATFDVALRFLHECPWDRLEKLRAAVPDIPFQMLLRGANAVGYTSYPDNVVVEFIRASKRLGMDVFRVFDSLNDLENMKVAIDAVGEVGGVIEGAVCYTGDVADPTRTKYTLDYYLETVRRLVDLGIHVLAVKDMAGLLKPASARLLVATLRREFPDLPIHVHTHDTAAAGVASMLAASEAGADVVDVAIDTMSGLTSQPSMGAVVAALHGAERDTGIRRRDLAPLEEYWERVREVYAPFESGLKSGSSDVYEHEMPGGQYTNLKFQANALGLEGRWTAIKHAYAAANRLLGDIVKVTPSSKVVGDLAQFMVQNDLDEDDVRAQAATLSFPSSVVDFMRGAIGHPVGGFPEPFRTDVLKGLTPFEGRPGSELPPVDFDALREELTRRHRHEPNETDLLSATLYPEVFEAFMEHQDLYSDLSVVPTRAFLAPLDPGEEISIEIQRGKRLIVKFETVGEIDARGRRPVFFELNGQPRTIMIPDRTAVTETVRREKADPQRPESVGAAMPGVVVEVMVTPGDEVERQAPLVKLSAMKMETVIAAPVSGKVGRVAVARDDTVEGGDLLV